MTQATQEISSSSTTSIVYPAPPWQTPRGGGLRGALRLFGPGAIIASVTIGSGETLFASRAGAIFGYALLWFILVCIACKLVQVYTGARYMVLTGEHPMQAWTRLPGPRGWFPAMLGGLSILCFPFWLGGLSLMLGTAINWMIGLEGATEDKQRLYAQIVGSSTLILAAALTFMQSYSLFEKAQTVIVAILLVSILGGVVLAPIEWPTALRGMFTVQLPQYEDWMKLKYPLIANKQTVMVIMAVFMGAIGGGTHDYIGYLSLFREKQWGALDDTRRIEPGQSPRIDASDKNLTLGRQWLRAPVVDVFTSFVCVAVFTMAFNLLGAAILHPQHVVPEKFALLSPQAQFLARYGSGFKYLYQLGIFMAFWGTIYGAFEIYSRTAFECFRPLISRLKDTPFPRFRLPVCMYALIGGLVLIWTVSDPVRIVEPAALIGTITCGLWCYAMIWADRKNLPERLRMNGLWIVFNLLAGTTLIAFGIKAIADYLH